MKYCNNCKQIVEPLKNFNPLLFLILCCTCVGWIFYLSYYLLKSKKCPMCKSQNWGIKPQLQEKKVPLLRQEKVLPEKVQKNSNYCPMCGNPLKGRFCELCGNEVELR